MSPGAGPSSWLADRGIALRHAAGKPLGWTAHQVDAAFMRFMRFQAARARRRDPKGPRPLDERLGELEALAQRLDQRREAVGELLVRQARPIRPVRRRERFLADGQVQDLTWVSDYRAYLPEVEARYRRHERNLRGAARLWLHAEPRPVAVLIHGYMGGDYRREERAWPVRWLFRQGLDVALFVLPLHGARASADRRGPPPFPSRDPRITIEGFRHGLGDLQDLAGWLHARGHDAVGVMGMSLGGYACALAATLMAELAFAVPIIPLSCLADFAQAQGRLAPDPVDAAREHRALERVHHPISPLRRTPVVPGSRVLVVAARADGVLPTAHAERLAAHFAAPLRSWPGGHLVQVGRAQCFRHVVQLLTELGLVPSPRGAHS